MDLKLRLYRLKERWKRKYHGRKKGNCIVLLYHRVLNIENDPQQLCVSVDNFEEQLTALKKTHVFLKVNEFFEILNSNQAFPKNALLITFDDGYADNYRNALPVLERLDLQALFFIATDRFNSGDLFWWDELDLIFDAIKRNGAEITPFLDKYKVDSSEELYQYYLAKCKESSSLKERKRLISELRTIVSIDETLKSQYAFLSIDELIALSQSRHAVIGAHTVNHLSLGHLPLDEQRTEVIASVNYLEKTLQFPVRHFSYPYGERHNFSNETMQLCQELGLLSSAANYCDYVDESANLFSYPRFVVRNDRFVVLKQKLKELV
jgi:peptidoglycan/xylan/chitin deacetylase (PgdA/CDA1 family)